MFDWTLPPVFYLMLMTMAAAGLVFGAARLNRWLYVWRRNLPDPAWHPIPEPKPKPELDGFDRTLWNKGQIKKLRRQLAEYEREVAKTRNLHLVGRVTNRTRLLRG